MQIKLTDPLENLNVRVNCALEQRFVVYHNKTFDEQALLMSWFINVEYLYTL